jgi:hypothetical protein
MGYLSEKGELKELIDKRTPISVQTITIPEEWEERNT